MDSNVLIDTKDIERTEWLNWRKKGIGGSDASVIMGLNKWKSPFQLYLEKIGEVDTSEDQQSEYAYWGNQLEELVAREFTNRTGKKVHRRNAILTSQAYPFMIANLDRMVVGEKAILECKTTNAFSAKEWEDDQIPESYIIQIQHYMAVTGDSKAYIACLIGGNKFIYKEVEKDEELISMIIEAEKDFWENHVLLKIPPVIDGSSAAEKFLKENFEKANAGTTVDLKAEYKDKINQYYSLKDQIEELEKQKATIENQLKFEMGQAEIGLIDHFIVNWKPITSNRVDSKALKKNYPDIYSKVCKPSSYRRFEIKEAK